jgi:hypothetical protein
MFFASKKLMNLLDLPDDIRHKIVNHLFLDYAVVTRFGDFIMWDEKKYNQCCEAQKILW